MALGQIIKKLRREADMTQEQLAQLLSISPQAVSRWETDMAMPDISMLPPLANLFEVTTDYLLEMEKYQKDARREEYEKEFNEYWKKENKEQNYQAALRAVTEYPGDMNYLEWLASDEMYLSFSYDEEEYREWLERSVKHYGMVLEHTKDVKLRHRALHGIVLALCYSGKKAEGREYAVMEEDEKERDELLNYCLEGEELKRHSQKVLDRKFKQFLMQIPVGQKCVEAYEMVEKMIYMMFPEGDFLEYHNLLQYNHIHKSFCLCAKKEWDAALEELGRARYHAEQMTKCGLRKGLRHLSPLMGLLEWEPSQEEGLQTDVDDFRECLKNNSCFDPLREREKFGKLLE